MSQTSIIAGALIVAYIVFVTVRGELPAYLAMLGIGGSSATTPSGCAAAAAPAPGSGTNTTTIHLPGININPNASPV